MIKKIIIVDDEKYVRASIRNRINWQELGIEVSAEAENGELALAEMRKKPIDVALIDICMPDMDGFELIKQAREILPNLRIIVLSGYSDYEHLRKGILLNVDDYLRKPINPVEFIRCISKIKLSDIESVDSEQQKTEVSLDACICSYIHLHYADKLSLNHIANELYISPNYLSTYFKQKTGQNLFDYIRDVRMERAKILLRYSDKNITEIAQEIGYSDMTYFERVFKKTTQLTPRAYRLSCKNPKAEETLIN